MNPNGICNRYRNISSSKFLDCVVAVDLEVVDFEGVDFDAVVLLAVDFEGVDFEGVDFDAVVLLAVDLEVVDFDAASLDLPYRSLRYLSYHGIVGNLPTPVSNSFRKSSEVG